MTRSTEPWVLGAIALGALALVGLGIATVGGPSTARAERNDQARLEDLQLLTTYVDCLAGLDAAGTLPGAPLPPDARCHADPPLKDRFTGAPYDYAVLSPRSYQLCATFERPETLDARRFYWGDKISFEPSTGCLTVNVR